MKLKIVKNGVTSVIDADSFCVAQEDTPAPPPKLANIQLVTIKTPWHAYQIGKYPVTVAEWRTWKGEYIPHCEEPYYSQCPITNISAYEAEEFCKAHGLRLPTEEEWEFAANSGYRTYPWGNEWAADCTNNYNDGPRKLTPVARYLKGQTPTGIYDMLGNCWEWTATENADKRVLRGGSCYFLYAHNLCASNRLLLRPDNYNHDIGFRCARDL